MSSSAILSASSNISTSGFQEMTMPERLDSETAPAIEQGILSQIANGTHDFVLNCSHVHFLTAAGLRMMLAVLRSVQAVHGHVEICHLQGQAKTMFEVCGFDSFFSIQDTSRSSLSRLVA